MRQDHHDPRRSWGCFRRQPPWRARSCSTARTSCRAASRRSRPHRWTDVAMVFQGAMNALNPVKTVECADRRADGVPRRRLRARHARRARRRAARVGRDPRRPRPAVSARALGRDAPASRDRDGARVRTEGPARRRADDRARRDGAGSDPRAAGLAGPTSSASRWCSSRTISPLSRRSASGPPSCTPARSSRPARSTLSSTTPRHPYTRLLFAATPDLCGDEEVLSIPGATTAARPRDRRMPVPTAL